jgi:hypothetical protein
MRLTARSRYGPSVVAAPHARADRVPRVSLTASNGRLRTPTPIRAEANTCAHAHTYHSLVLVIGSVLAAVIGYAVAAGLSVIS